APSDPEADAPAPEVAAATAAPVIVADGDSAAAAAAALSELPLTDGAVAATTTLIAPEAARTSAQEFKAAPQTVSDGKKTGLSDLEKVGLFVLGAVVVGQILDATVGKDKEAGGQQVVSNTGDRVVVLNPDGSYGLYKDDDAILRQAGSTVRTETYGDGSSRTIVQRSDGTQVVTVRNAAGRVLRRAQYDRLGRELVLLDDFAPEVAVNVASLPAPRITTSTRSDDASLRAAIAAREIAKLNRSFSLRQIRDIPQVRALAAEVDVEKVTFASGSAAISASQANALADLGAVMQDMLDANPAEMFLIEGHTDATGAAAMNLALSDRRAESVALALSEYFEIPPENMIVQGYGETELRINTQASETKNRRVAVRIITPLLRPRP
ncbi:MAG: OmpA family protein, partial [Cypionkella sp.]